MTINWETIAVLLTVVSTVVGSNVFIYKFIRQDMYKLHEMNRQDMDKIHDTLKEHSNILREHSKQLSELKSSIVRIETIMSFKNNPYQYLKPSDIPHDEDIK